MSALNTITKPQNPTLARLHPHSPTSHEATIPSTHPQPVTIQPHESIMSSNPPSSTSMASVWDTLNKMKARQAKALSKAPRQSTAHRKDAIALFEREISAAAQRPDIDGTQLLRALRDTLAEDEHARAVVDEHRRRVRANPNAEIAALQRVAADTASKLSLAAAAMKRANDIAYKMKLDIGG